MLNFTQFDELVCDVLVIGGGVAGMMAAHEAHLAGAHVMLLTKSTFPAGSSSMARRGYAAPLGHVDSRDNPYEHWKEIISGGYGINNQRLARIMAEEVIERTYTIDSWGLGLVKIDVDKYDQEYSPGEIYPRLLHCVSGMGKPLMKILSTRVKELGIEVHNNSFLVDLLKDATGTVVGAWGFKHREGKFIAIRAKSTVLCTGGAPQLHRINDSPPQVTGDGYAMGLRAGAELIDMEMIDYVLTTGWPEKMEGYGSNSHTFLAAGGQFLNRDGERFMKRYNPDAKDGVYENGHRSVINRGIGTEVFEGRGTDHGCIYFDVRDAIGAVGEKGENISRAFKNAGVDLHKEPFEVCSCPHTFLGGLRIDEHGHTTLPGFYAGGEATGGVHGSNRLAGAALADSFVFGSRTGRTAAREAAERKSPAIPKSAAEEVRASLAQRESASGGMSPEAFRLALQENVYNNIGQVRSEERLLKGLARLKALRQEAHSVYLESEAEPKRFKELMNIIETENLIDVASMIGTSALLRTESRGGHVRYDFSEQDDENWKVNLVAFKGEKPGEVRTRIDAIVEENFSAPAPA
ncbi:MAG: FAD-binding protein [Nitrospinaceae bacterium]|jgi:fumarate reductase (CoM/CoB) subunit A|nr:FAD-binding protein [Nitrospinaceae bacterium]MBT3434112.1 FAD-binding protein [Nitrospinaceae bacterium]MBT3823280.1 FAD-binding protein [Nitrospinaceae bacterium]MBT4431535.1 FAD-binding protein [Nitrospinaceae bacterium]MBT5946914.1 FAD-binding protein [Nitrospinaceae bacterium]